MTPPNAPYKLAQRVNAPIRLLATSAELSDYQKVKGVSALKIAKLAEAELGQS